MDLLKPESGDQHIGGEVVAVGANKPGRIVDGECVGVEVLPDSAVAHRLYAALGHEFSGIDTAVLDAPCEFSEDEQFRDACGAQPLVGLMADQAFATDRAHVDRPGCRGQRRHLQQFGNLHAADANSVERFAVSAAIGRPDSNFYQFTSLHSERAHSRTIHRQISFPLPSNSMN